MKRLQRVSFVVCLFLLVLSCEKRTCGCVPPPESPFVGDWNLTRITYGLTQKTVTPAEAGYTESLSFLNGKYRQTRNGIPVQTSDYSAVYPGSSSSEGLIYFRDDSTQQSFRLAGSKLILSERGPRGAVIADGSTYEYSR